MRLPIAIIAGLAAAALLPRGALAQNQAPPRCAAPEFRQFDFWVGEWDVYNAAGNLIGQNSIRRTLGFCVVEENWMGASGSVGSSFNIYDRASEQWHQTWVSNSGTLLMLDGSLEDGSMVLEGTSVAPDGTETLNRVTWSPLDDGRVRQHWETSTDGGETWNTSFDGYYQRRARS